MVLVTNLGQLGRAAGSWLWPLSPAPALAGIWVANQQVEYLPPHTHPLGFSNKDRHSIKQAVTLAWVSGEGMGTKGWAQRQPPHRQTEVKVSWGARAPSVWCCLSVCISAGPGAKMRCRSRQPAAMTTYYKQLLSRPRLSVLIKGIVADGQGPRGTKNCNVCAPRGVLRPCSWRSSWVPLEKGLWQGDGSRLGHQGDAKELPGESCCGRHKVGVPAAPVSLPSLTS